MKIKIPVGHFLNNYLIEAEMCREQISAETISKIIEQLELLVVEFDVERGILHCS